jgi:hypothetical protein
MKKSHVGTFENFGKQLVLPDELKVGVYNYNYVCHLYGFEALSDVNSIRCQLFKSGKYNEELLPPNEDSLLQHIRRANYQCYIWRNAAQPMLDLPSFFDHGWMLDDKGEVEINWMSIPAAADS